MEIFRGTKNIEKLKNSVATIGTFDGVHLGHRKVLDHLKKEATKKGTESLVITFWPHPRQILNSGNEVPGLLNSLENKILLLKEAAIDKLLIITFDKEFSRQSPQDFLENFLIKELKIQALVIGYDHRFGRNRTGSFSFIKQMSNLQNFDLHEIPALQIDGISVSSSKIRNALIAGDIETANRFLGYDYFFDALVIRGMGVGKKLDYPTANLQAEFDDKQIPADGVYVVKAMFNDNHYYGMLNSGMNPTFPDKGRSIEIHLFDFDDDIYGKSIRVSFMKRLREERKFSSADDLKDQMHQDKKEAISFIKKLP